MKRIQLTVLIGVWFILGSCAGSSPSDMKPIIHGRFSDNIATYYPSTDMKVSAIVIDKDSNVWYLRLNGFGQPRDAVKLFNINDFKK